MLRVTRALVITFLILTGCQAQNETKPVSCEDIVDPQLLTFPWETLAESDAGDWVSMNYPEATKIQEQNNSHYVAVHWIIDTESYLLLFRDRVHLLSLGLSPEPTIDDLLRCYGEPKYYTTEYTQAPEAAAIRLTIWYPQLGLTFVSAEYSSWRFMLKTKFDRQTRLYSATVVESGTIKEVLKRGTAYDEIVDDTLEEMRPWPQDFQVIEHKLE